MRKTLVCFTPQRATMKLRRFLSITALFVSIVLVSASIRVYAIGSLTISIPGIVSGDTSHCTSTLNIRDNFAGIATTDDDGSGHDYIAYLLRDGNNNVIDAYVTRFSLGAFTSTLDELIPSFDDLPDPVSRPFTLQYFDVPKPPLGMGDTPGTTVRDWVLAHGTLLASNTFDPSFVPGCAALPLASDACLPVPDGSVVGDTPYQAQVYWAPAKVSPGIFLNPGTYWVIGEDDTHQFYKILLSCQDVWVLKQDFQPSQQAPQNGTPLPTRAVS